MKNKEIFNKTSIRYFLNLKNPADKSRIEKQERNTIISHNILNTSSLSYFSDTSSRPYKLKTDPCLYKTLFCKPLYQNLSFLSALFFFSSLSLPAMAQHLRLALGQYDCLSNSQCRTGEYCDIDTNSCQSFPAIPECETCPECSEPITPDCSICEESIVCGDGQYKLNGTCVSCLSNEDCTQESVPVCDRTTYQYVSCYTANSAKPYWNGEKCVECTDDTDCAKRSDGKTICNEAKEECRIDCPAGSVWNDSYSACIADVRLTSTSKQYEEGCPNSSVCQTKITYLYLTFPSEITTGQWKIIGDNEKAKISGQVKLGTCALYSNSFTLTNNTIDLSNTAIFGFTQSSSDNNNSCGIAEFGQHLKLYLKQENNVLRIIDSANTHISASPWETSATIYTDTIQVLYLPD